MRFKQGEAMPGTLIMGGIKNKVAKEGKNYVEGSQVSHVLAQVSGHMP